MVLIINGRHISDSDFKDYAMMFNVGPVLYYKGKRVTEQWTISLIHTQPKDEFGASA